jgi:hypothetical protein
MSVHNYYSKIVANTFNENVITVKTLRSKFNEQTNPILQNDDRYKVEHIYNPSRFHLVQSKGNEWTKPAKKLIHLKQSDSNDFNYKKKRMLGSNKESNQEPYENPKKRLFPFKHLKDNVQRIIFSKDKVIETCPNYSGIKIRVDKPPSELTKRMNDKRSLMPSERNSSQRPLSRTLSSSVFKQDDGCSSARVDYNCMKYKNRPADTATDILRYTDGPIFRDEV